MVHNDWHDTVPTTPSPLDAMREAWHEEAEDQRRAMQSLVALLVFALAVAAVVLTLAFVAW